MISYERKCIFVHVPKTGGTSVEDAIWGPDWNQRTTEQLWMGNIRPGYNKYQSGGLQHLLATQIRQEVGADVFEDFFKFAFVRNPWDKVVSQFHYIKTRPMLLKHMGLGRFSSFRRYVETLVTSHERHVQSYPQWKFLYEEEPRSASSPRLVDFVGHFESLEDDFAIVANKLGLSQLRLPHAMASKKRKHYSTYYNRRTRDAIAQLYATDIAVFAYTFEMP